MLMINNKHGMVAVWGVLCLSLLIGCNKLVQVPDPISSITANETFSSDASATAAMLGIYSYMSGHNSFSSLQTTFCLGESADELIDETKGNEQYDIFLCNTLTTLSASGAVDGGFWQPAYFDIYSANSIISGVEASTGISPAIKNQLLGEAKFIRAFCYFYLTNIFGEVPLVLSTDFNQTALLSRSPQSLIYQQIINDLSDGETLMNSDFSMSGGMPIRANKWAAASLLARVYLYQKNWTGADSAASAVINSGQFALLSDPDSVFLANSREAILQLQTLNGYPYATFEGNFFVPFIPGAYASCWLTSQLLNSFEPNDLRRQRWVDSLDKNSVYYPYKYKIYSGPSDPAENYTLLRLAEQYLIRAEAEIQLGQLNAADSDLNVIRTRANLPSLPNVLTTPQLLSAVQQENKIEFFAEWGHRWLDLKRWGIAIPTLDTIYYKMGHIDSTQLLYPIPLTETQDDPDLSQNQGYNNNN